MDLDSLKAQSKAIRSRKSVVARLFGAVLVLSFPAMAGFITLSGLVQDGVGGVDGLRGVSSLAISPDGEHLYAVGNGEDALAVFSRDHRDGSLVYLEDHRDGWDGVFGMREPAAVAVSRDGRHVYVVTGLDDSLVVYSRDLDSGRLAFIDAYQDEVEGIFGLNGALSVVVTPDDRYVMVAGYTEDTLAVFSRQATSDDLQLVDVQQDGIDGVDMFGPTSVTVSPDSRFVYVAAMLDDRITIFSQDPTQDGVHFYDTLRTGWMPRSVAIDKSGTSAYIVGGNWLRASQRDPATGDILPAWLYTDEWHGADGLEGAASAVVTPAGDRMVVAGEFEHAVSFYWRDPYDGYIELETIFRDQEDGIDGIAYPAAFEVSPDSRFLYVAGSGDDAIAIFELPLNGAVFMDGFESGDLSSWGAAGQ